MAEQTNYRADIAVFYVCLFITPLKMELVFPPSRLSALIKFERILANNRERHVIDPTSRASLYMCNFRKRNKCV